MLINCDGIIISFERFRGYYGTIRSMVNRIFVSRSGFVYEGKLENMNIKAKPADLIVLIISVCLFIIPFFWLKPGFVDLGGDAGRQYYLDPWGMVKNTIYAKNFSLNSPPQLLVYELYLAGLMVLARTPTYLIAIQRGVQLSLAFLSVFLIVSTVLGELRAHHKHTIWTGVTAGIVYIGLISKNGWIQSLEAQNQIFLNPLIFFLLLKYLLTKRLHFLIIGLLISVPFSVNFGFSSAPSVVAFYPLAITFLIILIKFILHRPINWRDLLLGAILFVGLQSFHLIPMAASLFTRGNFYNNYVFSGQSIQSAGVQYFEANREALGKISVELFQPVRWGPNFLIFVIPVIILLGFLRRPTKLIAVTGLFFTATFFLVSANITNLGVSLYRTLFYIPGFMMFRSFDDKFFTVYSFFFTLLFAFAFYALIEEKKKYLLIILSLFVIGTTVWRISPFLQGKAIDAPLYQSKNVSGIFRVDPDLVDALSFVRSLPEGSVLTLPLTFPTYQIAYGKEGGAYEGISMVAGLGGKPDYPGFWSFGGLSQKMFDAITNIKVPQILQVLSTLNIRYVFYNSDNRIMDNFSDYPYTYPKPAAIRDQAAYKKLLSSLPLTKLFGKGFYTVYKVDQAPVSSFSNYNRDETYVRFLYIGLTVSLVTLGIIIYLLNHEHH